MDVIINLLQRDRVDEAIDWVMEAVLLGMTHEMEAEDVLRLLVDEVAALLTQEAAPSPPYLPQLRGWDNVIYGEAAFRTEE